MQDHVPYLRYLTFLTKARSRVAAEVRSRRDKWLAALLGEVKSKFDNGESQSCVAARLLSDTEEQLTPCKSRLPLLFDLETNISNQMISEQSWGASCREASRQLSPVLLPESHI